MFNRSDEVHLGIIHGSVLAVTTLALSPGQPRDKVSASGPGVGYFSSGLAAGVGEGGQVAIATREKTYGAMQSAWSTLPSKSLGLE